MRRRGTVAKEAPSRAHELRLSVRRRRGSELERGGHQGVHVAQRVVPAHPAYAVLCRGLDIALLAMSARPVG
jgi:hypothetical protein